MKLINKLTKRELELLKEIDINIEDKDYSVDEIIKITDDTTLNGEISNLEGKDYKSTSLAEEYADLVDKLISANRPQTITAEQYNNTSKIGNEINEGAQAKRGREGAATRHKANTLDPTLSSITRSNNTLNKLLRLILIIEPDNNCSFP